MKNLTTLAVALAFGAITSHGQIIIADNYDVTGSGTGFTLDNGVNTGINPPTTRLTGSTASTLRYYATDTGRAAGNYTIAGSKLSITAATGNGRLTLSTDGTSPFDFGSSLGTSLATAANPIGYDITISMANLQSGTTRFSFALGTVENNANLWDFGIQLYKAAAGNNFYTIGKRIDVVSATPGTDSSGATGDINAAITTTGAGTAGTQLDFLMRVTDAGAESTTFNSRIQLSMNGGSSWFYDTAADGSLTSGFRFDTVNRFIMWDTAGSGSGSMTYDNFSINLTTPAVPEPSMVAFGILGGLAILIRRRR